MTHTAEEVRHCARYINRAGSIGYEGMYAKASDMLTAYAALLERSSVVTEEVVEQACIVYFAPNGDWPCFGPRSTTVYRRQMRAALTAVWPVAAEPAQSKCPICFEDEPHTGTCGSSDPRALCNLPIAQPADSGRVDDEAMWALIAKAEAAGAIADEGDEGKFWTLTTAAFYALQAALAAQGQPAERVPDVLAMVNRFLGWSLPKDFAPDGGISFNPLPARHMPHCWPVGTNLFTAAQATAMVEYMLAAAPQPTERVPEGWRATHDDHTRMWTVHTPSGDSIGIYDQAAGIANVVLRQLAQHLAAAPQPGESNIEDSRNG